MIAWQVLFYVLARRSSLEITALSEVRRNESPGASQNATITLPTTNAISLLPVTGAVLQSLSASAIRGTRGPCISMSCDRSPTGCSRRKHLGSISATMPASFKPLKAPISLKCDNTHQRVGLGAPRYRPYSTGASADDTLIDAPQEITGLKPVPLGLSHRVS